MPTLESTTEDARIYEFAILYPYPLTQKEEMDFLKEVEAVFHEAGGKQVAKDAWGRRGLAYRIAGHSEANFVVYHYELDPTKIVEIDQQLRIMKKLLRHLVVKPPKGYQIVKFSEAYQEWLKTRESVDEVRAREREEKLQEQVAKKAKRQAEKVTEKKKVADEEKPMLTEEQLTQKLDELISDDTLDI